MSIRAEDALALPVKDRIKLVADIWDSIAASPDQIELVPETIALLEQRLKEYRDDPQGAAPWEEVKDRILNPRK